MAKRKTIFEYQGDVKFTPDEIETNLGEKVPSGRSTANTVPGGTPDKSQDELEYFNQLDEIADEAIVIDDMIDIVSEMIDDQTQDMRIPVDPKKRPSLAEAVASLGAKLENDIYIIDQDIWKRANNILQNSVSSTFGFDPTNAPFSQIGSEGLEIPKGQGRKAQDCIEASEEDIISYADDESTDSTIPRTTTTNSYSEVQDKKDFNFRINTLRLMILHALKAALNWLLGKFKKLEKVKIVGKYIKKFITKPIRRAIKWCDREINKLMPKIPQGQKFASPTTVTHGKQIKAYGMLGEADWKKGVRKWHEWWDGDYELVDGTVSYDEANDLILDKELDYGATAAKGEIYPSNLEEMDPDDLAEKKYPRLVPAAEADSDIDGIRDDSVNSNASAMEIPANCIKNAQAIADRVNEWALYDGSQETGGPINPSAILLKPMVDEALNYHETAKAILTLGDESDKIKELRDNTRTRPRQKKRWQHKPAENFRSTIVRM